MQPYSKLSSWAPQALGKIPVAFENVLFVAVDTTLPRVSTLVEYVRQPDVLKSCNGDFTANIWFDCGTRWRSLSRHCDISRKVAGSISGRSVALSPTQHLWDMNTKKISLGVKAADAEGWQLYHPHVKIALKSGSLNLLELLGSVQSCTGIALPLWLPSVAFLDKFLSQGFLGVKLTITLSDMGTWKKAPSLWRDIPSTVLHTLHNGMTDDQFNDGSTLTDSLDRNGHTLLRTASWSVYLSGCFICAFAKLIVLEYG